MTSGHTLDDLYKMLKEKAGRLNDGEFLVLRHSYIINNEYYRIRKPSEDEAWARGKYIVEKVQDVFKPGIIFDKEIVGRKFTLEGFVFNHCRKSSGLLDALLEDINNPEECFVANSKI